MPSNLSTDVLIVGAGPTGLMAANQLGRFGIDFILVDHKAGPTIESRAIAVTARSLEIYQQIGLADYAIENGQRMTEFNLFVKGKKRGDVKIGEIGKGISKYSYMLAFEQSLNEKVLAENLVRNGKKIHWQHEFLRLEEYETTVKARLKSKEGEITLSAKYVIACDGASSPIRQQLGLSFKGGTYAHRFFVADTVLKWNLGYNKLIIAPGDKNFCAFLPLKHDETYRIIGTLPLEFRDNDNITFQHLDEVIKKTMQVDMQFDSVNWFSVYRLHHRRVEQFRKGRVFLAGDSAHIHSPAGGQGMNTGLQDAYNICWKLALVLRKQANESLLETYNEERLPFAKFLLEFTDRGFMMMTSRNWLIRLIRKYIAFVMAGIVLSTNRIKPFIFRTISQTGYSYKKSSLSKSFSQQRLKFRAGDRLPYFMEDDIYLRFTNSSFHLLHIHDKVIGSDTSELIKQFPFPITVVEDQAIEKWRKLGVSKELFILVRPDNYLALLLDKMDKITISKYLNRYFN